MDKIGSAMGIKNFKEVCNKAEEMLRLGQKDGAVNYIVQTTGIEKSKAERIAEMFESRLRKN